MRPDRPELRRRRRLISLALAVAACGGQPAPPAPAPTASAPAPRTTGSDRMRAALVAVSDDARQSSIYFEDQTLRQLEKQLGQFGPDADPLERFRLHSEIASHRLHLGRDIEEAIAAWEAAVDLLDELAPMLTERQAVGTILDLAFGYLRYGETQNCVARHTAQSCLIPIEGSGVHVDRTGSTKAIERFVQALDRAPRSLRNERLRARWLLNIAYMTIGGYPDQVPEEHRIPPETFAAEAPFLRFEDVAPELGVNAFDLAGGVVVDDFDRDGRLDIVTSTMDLDGPLRLFVNVGSGRFVERTGEAGLDGLTGGLNCLQADYDNDGNIDILVLRGAWLRSNGRHPNSLLRNLGDGTFVDVTAEAGLMFRNAPTQAAGWADYDLDGDLDLFVGNENKPGERHPSELFRNEGDGTFREVAAAAGVTNERHSKGVSWGDYDGDGWPDLFVSNLFETNRLYRNQRDGTFVDVAAEVGVTGPEASFPTWFWDFDNDGHLDLYVASYISEPAATFADLLGVATGVETMALYRGDGRGGLTDVTEAMGLDRVTATMGANFGDVDGDGYPDIYLGTGTPQLDAVMPNRLLHNRGGAGFADVTTAADVGHLQKGHGIAINDIDNDGDRDIYAQLGGLFPVDAFGNALFLNPGFGHRFLTVELVGRRANRSAIGARVRAVIRDADGERSVYSWVNSGGSFGANSLRRELGLGTATAVERLEIRWPGAAEPQVFAEVPIDRFVRAVEGVAELELLHGWSGAGD